MVDKWLLSKIPVLTPYLFCSSWLDVIFLSRPSEFSDMASRAVMFLYGAELFLQWLELTSKLLSSTFCSNTFMMAGK